jgi:hypothetical protein
VNLEAPAWPLTSRSGGKIVNLFGGGALIIANLCFGHHENRSRDRILCIPTLLAGAEDELHDDTSPNATGENTHLNPCHLRLGEAIREEGRSRGGAVDSQTRGR